MLAVQITEKNFEEEILKSDIPVLVDFWAEWCAPCKMMGTIVDEIASSLDGEAKIAKINIDEAQMLASQFNVMSIPTFMIFKGGKVVDQIVGAMSKENLMDKINTHL